MEWTINQRRPLSFSAVTGATRHQLTPRPTFTRAPEPIDDEWTNQSVADPFECSVDYRPGPPSVDESNKSSHWSPFRRLISQEDTLSDFALKLHRITSLPWNSFSPEKHSIFTFHDFHTCVLTLTPATSINLNATLTNALVVRTRQFIEFANFQRFNFTVCEINWLHSARI